MGSDQWPDKMGSDKMGSDKMSSDKMGTAKMGTEKMASDKTGSDKVDSVRSQPSRENRFVRALGLRESRVPRMSVGRPIVKRLQAKHPRAVRWFHWIKRVPLLAGMIWSGLLIYWANDVYRIGWGGFTLFHFFPDWFYHALNLRFHLAEGMAWHFFLMWLFAFNGAIYVAYTAISGEWRYSCLTAGRFVKQSKSRCMI